MIVAVAAVVLAAAAVVAVVAVVGEERLPRLTRVVHHFHHLVALLFVGVVVGVVQIGVEGVHQRRRRTAVGRAVLVGGRRPVRQVAHRTRRRCRRGRGQSRPLHETAVVVGVVAGADALYQRRPIGDRLLLPCAAAAAAAAAAAVSAGQCRHRRHDALVDRVEPVVARSRPPRLIDVVVGVQLAQALVDAVEAHAEHDDAPDRQNDDDVVRKEDVGRDHLRTKRFLSHLSEVHSFRFYFIIDIVFKAKLRFFSHYYGHDIRGKEQSNSLLR